MLSRTFKWNNVFTTMYWGNKMNFLYEPWIYLVIFLLSGGFILYERRKRKAQFVVTTGCLLTIFYIVCFTSACCTILNFIWKWVLWSSRKSSIVFGVSSFGFFWTWGWGDIRCWSSFSKSYYYIDYANLWRLWAPIYFIYRSRSRRICPSGVRPKIAFLF